MNTESLALDFKSATLYAVRVVLHSADTGRLADALAQRMADAGSFFEHEPVVIDASRIDDAIDWPQLLDALREHNLPPIGVVAEGANLEAARAAGLTPVDLSTAAPRPQAPDAAAAVRAAEAAAVPVPQAVSAPPPAAPAAAPTDAPAVSPEPQPQADVEAEAPVAAPAPAPAPSAMVINRPLRSGQRVYARQTDLVVIGMVSQGAEVIADGNVHVYGPLRGKAMAGARGDTSARIFTTQLDAELLAVAGVYRVVEAKLDPSLHNQPALVWLDGEALRVEPLKG
ncbi:septum site-determining protein MinC [Bordetella genomosp. 13]|uniref:Probable septum site-determining protein MinC n=1 Tax=Bordetella genomosp. 13 TaxID=463040 RepID=A0A1W6ZG77_9BORD|nr:septum site-determining protein MinC [Bordetella genomosp. 13]ARP96292.1 septum site-determining protein MinC [Bordetella genomosp. 13]